MSGLQHPSPPLQLPLIVLCDAPYYPSTVPSPIYVDITKISQVTYISSKLLLKTLPIGLSEDTYDEDTYDEGFSPSMRANGGESDEGETGGGSTGGGSTDGGSTNVVNSFHKTSFQEQYDAAMTTTYPHLIKTLLPSQLGSPSTNPLFSLVTVGPMATALGLSLYSLKTRGESDGNVVLPSGHKLHKLTVIHGTVLPEVPGQVAERGALLPSNNLLYMMEYNQTAPTAPLRDIARITLLCDGGDGDGDAPINTDLLRSLGASVTTLSRSVDTVQNHVAYVLPLLQAPLRNVSSEYAAPSVAYTLSMEGNFHKATYRFTPRLTPSHIASLTMHPLSLTGSYYQLNHVFTGQEDFIYVHFDSPKATFTADKIRKGIERRLENPTPEGVGECNVM
jgi:hypothetical protein